MSGRRHLRLDGRAVRAHVALDQRRQRVSAGPGVDPLDAAPRVVFMREVEDRPAHHLPRVSTEKPAHRLVDPQDTELPCQHHHSDRRFLERAAEALLGLRQRVAPRAFASVMSRATVEAPVTSPRRLRIGEIVTDTSITTPSLRRRVVSK